MAYSFREHSESKGDVTKDGTSNYTPITAAKDTDNPFFEAPPKLEEPAEKEDCKVDVMSLIGKRGSQKILASPDLALSRKAVKGKRASAAHRVLARFASQDVGRFESENLVKGDINVLTDENKPMALKSVNEMSAEVGREESKEAEEARPARLEQRAAKEVEESREDAAAEIYHSPRASAPCCANGIGGGCVLL